MFSEEFPYISSDILWQALHNLGVAMASVLIVEDDVFIGANCTILKNVRIGEGSIIAAGSIVTKEVPSGEIWGGVPARYLKKL